MTVPVQVAGSFAPSSQLSWLHVGCHMPSSAVFECFPMFPLDRCRHCCPQHSACGHCREVRSRSHHSLPPDIKLQKFVCQMLCERVQEADWDDPESTISAFTPALHVMVAMYMSADCLRASVFMRGELSSASGLWAPYIWV